MGESRRSYYETLGVDRSARPEEIRRAYRRLARQHHPDVNKSPEAEARFKEINEAYHVLNDPDKRATYDRFGRVDLGGWDTDFGGFGGFTDIFEDFLAGFTGTRARRGRRVPTPGADLRYELRLTFEEGVFGCEKELEVSRLEKCPNCGGSGAEPGTEPIRCPECDGIGEVRRVRQSLFGSFVSVTTCPRCRGEGEVATTPCRECWGGGRVRRTRRLAVQVPAGVDDGAQLKLAGEGEAGLYGGPPGNLYASLSDRRHAFFRREGYDVHLELPVNIVQAAWGAELKVPTLDGAETLSIPAGTQTGESFRLPGRGVPHLRGKGRGDEVIAVRVVTPRRLSPEQANLLRKLGEFLDTDVNSRNYKSLFDRMREAMGR